MHSSGFVCDVRPPPLRLWQRCRAWAECVAHAQLPRRRRRFRGALQVATSPHLLATSLARRRALPYATCRRRLCSQALLDMFSWKRLAAAVDPLSGLPLATPSSLGALVSLAGACVRRRAPHLAPFSHRRVCAAASPASRFGAVLHYARLHSAAPGAAAPTVSSRSPLAARPARAGGAVCRRDAVFSCAALGDRGRRGRADVGAAARDVQHFVSGAAVPFACARGHRREAAAAARARAACRRRPLRPPAPRAPSPLCRRSASARRRHLAGLSTAGR
jgi:hypothetical protein